MYLYIIKAYTIRFFERYQCFLVTTENIRSGKFTERLNIMVSFSEIVGILIEYSVSVLLMIEYALFLVNIKCRSPPNSSKIKF